MLASSFVGAALFTAPIPDKILGVLQGVSIIACNYAMVPQIYLTFKTKKAGWSFITASMSLCGCLVRVFTTMQLTKDPIVLSGYLLGAANNLIVLLQILAYREKK